MELGVGIRVEIISLTEHGVKTIIEIDEGATLNAAVVAMKSALVAASYQQDAVDERIGITEEDLGN